MKKHTIELSDELSRIYEHSAKINRETPEEAMQLVLKQAAEPLLKWFQKDWTGQTDKKITSQENN